MSSKVDSLYEPRIAIARQAVAAAPIVRRMLARNIDEQIFERFFIEYCSLGVQMTEPVEGWIARAGARCVEAGLHGIGEQLQDHARHEADHHLMFIADTANLVRAYNGRYGVDLSPDALINRPPTSAMVRYIDLHEQTIGSDLPAGQVAIELEIERLSVVLVPDLLAQCKRVLGQKTLDSLSFLSSHAALDIGHTHLNTRLMEDVLSVQPDAADALVRIGGEALAIYMAFFEECLNAAEAECMTSAEYVSERAP